MSPATAQYLDAIEHLPVGATLIVRDVDWDEYERLLQELAHRPGLRVSYDRGTLEVMSPSAEHDAYARVIDKLVWLYLDARGRDVESYGSATWRLKSAHKGVEPDSCFYIANAGLVIGKRVINLEFDPPPDVVVEIDITSETLKKLPIYAALQVPEVWRYDGTRVHFHALVEAEYREIAESRAVPGLSAAMLAEALQQSKTAGQAAALRAFRDRHAKPPA